MSNQDHHFEGIGPFTVDLANSSILKVMGYHSSTCGYCKPRRKSPRTELESDITPQTSTIISSSGSGNGSNDDEHESKDTKGAYYLSSPQLSVHDYQALSDYGWRRCGNVFYLPDSGTSCCIHHTIRLPVDDFRPAREHRHAIHRWNHLVLGDQYERELARNGLLRKKHSDFDLPWAVHMAEQSSLPDSSSMASRPAHRFRTVLEPAAFTDEKYKVYREYQMAVHQDKEEDISPSQFRRFLCDSPLFAPIVPAPVVVDPNLDIPPTTTTATPSLLGAYHLCFYLDDQLVAMSVLDLLPHAVSSVYFFYDTTNPTLHGHSMGKVSALHEFDLARRGGYGYYYMGYLIWNCPKMRYKASYRPQQILDWSTRQWLSLQDPDVQAALERTNGRSTRSDTIDLQKKGEAKEGEDGQKQEAEVITQTGGSDHTITPEEIAALYRAGKTTMFELSACVGAMTAEEVVGLVDMEKLLVFTSLEKGTQLDTDDPDTDDSGDATTDEDEEKETDEESPESNSSKNEREERSETVSTPSLNNLPKRILSGTAYRPRAFTSWISPTVFDKLQNGSLFQSSPSASSSSPIGGNNRSKRSKEDEEDEKKNIKDMELQTRHHGIQVKAIKTPGTLNFIFGELLAMVGPVLAKRVEEGAVAVSMR